MVADLLVHHRLGQARVVRLVVAAPPVAHEVDEDVAAEASAVPRGEPRGLHGRLRIVRVRVEHRRVEHVGRVGRVPGEQEVARLGGEADLVVGDDVDRAARRIALQRLEVERLRDHTLGRERGVPVNQDRKRRARVVLCL